MSHRCRHYLLHPIYLACLASLIVCLLLPAQEAGAAPIDKRFPQVQKLFPAADRFGEVEGDPPAAPVFQDGQLLGYVVQTIDVAKIPAYSGKPINLLVGLDVQGTITGAIVVEHHEPILLVGIPEHALDDFTDQYADKSVRDRVRVGASRRKDYVGVDGITGATVTVMVINEVIMRSARKVAESRGLPDGGTAPAKQAPIQKVREDLFAQADWRYLTGNGAVRRLFLSRGEVDQAFKNTEAEGVEAAPPEKTSETFIDLYYAYLNPPTIGRNLLGESQYNWLMNELKPGEHTIGVMARGIYSFKGSGYVRGGIFDRIQLQQNNQTIAFRDLDHHRLSDVYAEGIPDFKEMAIFIIRDSAEFDPGRPWKLELLVRRQTGPLDSVFVTFTGEYALPEKYLEPPEPPPTPEVRPAPPEKTAAPAIPEEPIWIQLWRERYFQIGVLVGGLLALTSILIFQDWLARRPRLLFWIRHGFLLYTVFFIGWYALAQLSVVNVLTFTNAVFQEFRWDTFLIDPMMFLLWSFVAVSLLLWGRGVYCGWLCPYGAMQELINETARRFKVRQFEFPFAVHERLWAIKYIILLLLFGVSLQSLAEAERYAEVEPFKTAVTLRFQREWGYVLYAGGLLAISIFNRKFFCRYLCPLGAALAIPARIRLFDWLKRHKECGKPCQICANECEVQAIHPTGEINANECHYCLDCQLTYWNAYKCPPMIDKRKRRERASKARQSVQRMEQALGASAGLEDIEVRVEPGPSTRRQRSDKSDKRSPS